MAFDFETFTAELTQADSMDDLPTRIRGLCPLDLREDQVQDIAAVVAPEGGSANAIVGELKRRGFGWLDGPSLVAALAAFELREIQNAFAERFEIAEAHPPTRADTEAGSEPGTGAKMA